MAKKLLKVSRENNVPRKCLEETTKLLNDTIPDLNLPTTSASLLKKAGKLICYALYITSIQNQFWLLYLI